MNTTRDQRILAMYKAEVCRFDYRNGYGPSPVLAVARRFKMPCIQVRGIVREMKQRRAEELDKQERKAP